MDNERSECERPILDDVGDDTDAFVLETSVSANPFPPKSDWGSGPWQDEPDELAFSYGDIGCRIVRNPHFGSLNGYVSVPPSHPWYGRSYDEIDAHAHGGLTYAEKLFPDWQNGGTYATKTDELWWIGFDCAHAWDAQPGLVAWERSQGFSPFPGVGRPDQYRDLEYVKNEVENLARQAIAAMR